MNLRNLAIAAAMGIGLASPLMASTIDSSNNDGVIPVYGSSPQAGTFGDNWLALGPLTLEVSFLGAEAGFTNSFSFGGTQLFSTSGTGGSWQGASGSNATVHTFNGIDGLLDFEFCTGGGSGVAAGCVANGSNPSNDDPTQLNFFSKKSVIAGLETLDLWFDDTGGGNDDNHDDFAVRLQVAGEGSLNPVPLPASALLLLGGMGGLAAMRRRKKA